MQGIDPSIQFSCQSLPIQCRPCPSPHPLLTAFLSITFPHQFSSPKSNNGPCLIFILAAIPSSQSSSSPLLLSSIPVPPSRPTPSAPSHASPSPSPSLTNTCSDSFGLSDGDDSTEEGVNVDPLLLVFFVFLLGRGCRASSSCCWCCCCWSSCWYCCCCCCCCHSR